MLLARDSWRGRDGLAVVGAQLALVDTHVAGPFFPAREHDDDALPAARRAWVLARDRGHRDALLTRYDVPSAGSPRPAPGRELSLHPRP